MNREISAKAKLFAAAVLAEVKAQPADNPHSYFLCGRYLLSKDEFNEFNDEKSSVFHGYQVIYGPFDSVQTCTEFVQDYDSKKYQFPFPDEWYLAAPGKMHVLTPYVSGVEFVNEKSSKFYAHHGIRKMQEQVEAAEEAKRNASKAIEQEAKNDEERKKEILLALSKAKEDHMREIEDLEKRINDISQ